MFQMNVYLNFHGNTMQAFKFYQSVFGGEFQLLQLMNGVPGTEKLSAEDQEKVMHISLPVGTNMMLHGTDTLESMGHTLNVGDNVHLMLTTDTKEEADRLFIAISEGGKPDMPMQDTFWGAYFGSFTDKFGIQWMIDYEYPK